MIYVMVGFLVILELILMIFLTTRFIRFFIKYKYMGNSLYYIIPCYILCFLYSVFVAIRPVEGLVEPTYYALGILNSFVEGVKMMVGGFDGAAISTYLNYHEPWAIIFAISYLTTSFFVVEKDITKL